MSPCWEENLPLVNVWSNMLSLASGRRRQREFDCLLSSFWSFLPAVLCADLKQIEHMEQNLYKVSLLHELNHPKQFRRTVLWDWSSISRSCNSHKPDTLVLMELWFSGWLLSTLFGTGFIHACELGGEVVLQFQCEQPLLEVSGLIGSQKDARPPDDFNVYESTTDS